MNANKKIYSRSLASIRGWKWWNLHRSMTAWWWETWSMRYHFSGEKKGDQSDENWESKGDTYWPHGAWFQAVGKGIRSRLVESRICWHEQSATMKQTKDFSIVICHSSLVIGKWKLWSVGWPQWPDFSMANDYWQITNDKSSPLPCPSIPSP